MLLRSKFRPYLSETEVASYLRLVETTTVRADDPELAESLSPGPGDDYLVALAESIHADCLVSGDQHPLGLERPGLNVLNPAEFWII